MIYNLLIVIGGTVMMFGISSGIWRYMIPDNTYRRFLLSKITLIVGFNIIMCGTRNLFRALGIPQSGQVAFLVWWGFIDLIMIGMLFFNSKSLRRENRNT